MKIKIFTILTILLLYVVTSVNCAQIEYVIDGERSKADSKTIFITSLILSLIDLVSCLYIFLRTFLQWKQQEKNSIPMNFRFPFYISLIEFFVFITQIINLPHVGDMWLHPLCSIIGFFSMFFLAFVMSLITFITFVNWYKVKKSVEFNSGRYDYIVFLVSSGIAIFYTLLGVGEYGKVRFWCTTKPDNKSVLYIILVIIIIHITSLSIFYLNTRAYMKKLKTNQLSFNGQHLPGDDERIIVEKTISYTLVFIFQLFLLILYIFIMVIITFENTAAVLFRILGVSIGSLLITLQYIINEGWKHKPISTTSPQRQQKHLSQISSQTIATSSIRDSINNTDEIRLPFTRIQVEVVQQQTTAQQSEIW